jgi:ribosome biogenesis GTPase
MGWSAWFADRFDSAFEPARVASASREHFLLWTASSGEQHATISGRFRYQNPDLRPVTGDWVLLRDHSVIENVLPRRTRISRKDPGRGVDEQVLAANVDRLFIVSGLDHDFNPRRLERYLLLAAESGAEPVIVLNKADLHDDVSPFVERTQTIANCEILAVSAREGWGLAAIPSLLRPGETGALIGSSGAGKSTIVNALLGEERQRTTAVRDSNQRGRHTTTHRELLWMPGDWLLIDMPGLRELQLWADPERVDGSFAEIAELATQCRFRDCRRQGEPGCAVAAAELDEDRLRSYAKLQRELEHLDRQRDVHAAIALKNRWKTIHKAMRNFDKRK